MRTLYKALASVGMIALSTAAALSVRHLSIAAKKRKNQNLDDSAQQIDSDAQKTQIETAQDEIVVTADTEIKPDQIHDDSVGTVESSHDVESKDDKNSN